MTRMWDVIQVAGEAVGGKKGDWKEYDRDLGYGYWAAEERLAGTSYIGPCETNGTVAFRLPMYITRELH